MTVVIHTYVHENNFIYMSKTCQGIPYDLLEPGGEEARDKFFKLFAIKEWEGYYFIDEEPTEKNLRVICKESPVEINRYFPKHEGIAYLTSVTKTKPIEVKFQGSGLLKFNGEIID